MKRGFTLVELLAVILIIGILATVSSVSLIGSQREMKKKMYCEKVDLMLKDAIRYGDKSSDIKAGNWYYEYTVEQLINAGVYKRDEGETLMANPIDGSDMANSKIGIYIKNRRANAFYIESSADIDYESICEITVPSDRPTTKYGG